MVSLFYIHYIVQPAFILQWYTEAENLSNDSYSLWSQSQKSEKTFTLISAVLY